MKLTAIAAVARNGVIGVDGGMPWDIPEDFARFKKITMGSNLIMGRTTFHSIGDVLPGRISIVISRTAMEGKIEQHPPAKSGQETKVIWVTSLDAALAVVDRTKPVFIGGGSQIYHQAWPLLTDLDITQVDQTPVGDAFFPEIDQQVWKEISREPRDGFDFVQYTRREPLIA